MRAFQFRIQMNLKKISEEIDTEDENLFFNSLKKAYTLTPEVRADIANRIKYRVYNYGLKDTFLPLYCFLRDNLGEDSQNFAHKIHLVDGILD